VYVLFYGNFFILVNKVTKETVTNPTTEASASWEETFIKYVQDRPPLYDFRLPLQERTNSKKNNLWTEIYNLFGGKISTIQLKAKWKYLRDCYLRAKKRVTKYKPSGSASQSTPEPGFRHFILMKFLDDSSNREQ